MADGFRRLRPAIPRRRHRHLAGRRLGRRAQFTLIGAAVTLLIAAAAVTVTTADAATQDGIPDGAVKASSYVEQAGTGTEHTIDTGGGLDVGWLSNGDWLRYQAVELGPAGALTASVRLAAAYADRTGTVEIHADARTGPLLATVPVTGTGGWQSWSTRTGPATSPGGTHDVFLVIRSSQPMDFVNLNWFLFTAGGTSPGDPSASMPEMSMPASSGVPGGGGSPSPAMSMPPAAPGQWIPVDQAAWERQLAQFAAMTPRPLPTDRRRNAEFNATCVYSHSAQDDPIVFPGQPGRSHTHSFLGNNRTNAFTDTADLFAFTASSCQPGEDHSAYWIPTLYEHGAPVEPDQVIVYYGSLLDDKTKTVPMPRGLRMIAGDAKRQVPTPLGAVNQFFCAGGPQDGRTRSTDGNWPVCDGGTLHFMLRFPDCWDGAHLDSPDHRSHVSFGAGGVCPAAFPVPIPAVTFSIAYPTSGTVDGFRLASGMASSMHGDAFFAWDDDAMAHRVKDCVVQQEQCDTFGRF